MNNSRYHFKGVDNDTDTVLNTFTEDSYPYWYYTDIDTKYDISGPVLVINDIGKYIGLLQH